MVNGFGETSIGLDEMASVLNGSHRQNNPLLISDDLTGWKATIGANGTAMDFHPSNSMKRQWFSIVDNHKGKNFKKWKMKKIDFL